MLTTRQRQFIEPLFPANFTLREMVEGSNGHAVIPSTVTALFWNDLTEVKALRLCLLAHRLQVLRDALGAPIFVTNAFRPAWYELSKKRSKNGAHPNAIAADIKTANMTKLLRITANWQGGRGVYPWGIHLDLAANRRW
jgi:uncharacterized protein YcbK (DUF882 family)